MAPQPLIRPYGQTGWPALWDPEEHPQVVWVAQIQAAKVRGWGQHRGGHLLPRAQLCSTDGLPDTAPASPEAASEGANKPRFTFLHTRVIQKRIRKRTIFLLLSIWSALRPLPVAPSL